MYTYIYATLFHNVVPTPSVHVTALDIQMIGSPLLLRCDVSTVKGITSSVDIVWMDGDGNETIRTLVAADNTTHNIYSDNYTIPALSEKENGTKYQCKAIINASTLVEATSDIVGKYHAVS